MVSLCPPLLALSLLSALAGGEAPASHERVARSLGDYAMEQCEADQAEVLFLGLGWTIDPTPEQELRWTGDPCKEQITVYLTVLEQGAFVGRYSLRPGLDVRAEGLVATRPAAAGEPVQVRSEQVLVWQLGPRSQGSPVARVEIRAGDVVNTHNAMFGYNLSAGTTVTLDVRRGPVHLQGTGELMRDARYGEQVPVRNNETGQVIEGLLHADGHVEI